MYSITQEAVMKCGEKLISYQASENFAWIDVALSVMLSENDIH
jgi:hypothetical protein